MSESNVLKSDDVSQSANGVEELFASSLEKAIVSPLVSASKYTMCHVIGDGQGDNSLEPGEVKTPTPGSSPTVSRDGTSTRQIVQKPIKPAEQLAKEALAKAMKTVSQMEAEACEEKVRAILELDAKRRKEEVEKRKREEAERKLRQINDLAKGDNNDDDEKKRKEKAERKRLKKLKKVHKAAKKALEVVDELDIPKNYDHDRKNIKIKKTKQNKIEKDDEDTEGLCSTTDSNDDNVNKNEFPIMSTVDATATTAASEITAVTMNSSNVIHGHLHHHHSMHSSSHTMLLPHPNQYYGFRPMNLYMRGTRTDFVHVPGTFMMRPRGGMRGRIPYAGCRLSHFYPSGNTQRLHAPPQQQNRLHTPPPARGHSPILPPTSADLLWTEAKPSISYAFKQAKKESKVQQISLGNEQRQQEQQQQQLISNYNSLLKFPSSKNVLPPQQAAATIEQQAYSKEHKKLKKSQEPRDGKKKHKIKTSSSMKQKKAEKSSKRKIEKIRKSYGPKESCQDKLDIEPKQHEGQPETKFQAHTHLQSQPQSGPQSQPHPAHSVKANESAIPNSPEMWNILENIKTEKPDVTDLKCDNGIFQVMPKPMINVKIEPGMENISEVSRTKHVSKIEGNNKNETLSSFDIFADSSPVSISDCAVSKKSVVKEEHHHKALLNSQNKLEKPVHNSIINTKEKHSKTPPLPKSTKQLVTKTSLEKALEVKRRIDKLLLQDDLQMEAIEAAKQTLLQKTQKHQSKKLTDSKYKQTDLNVDKDNIKLEKDVKEKSRPNETELSHSKDEKRQSKEESQKSDKRKKQHSDGKISYDKNREERDKASKRKKGNDDEEKSIRDHRDHIKDKLLEKDKSSEDSGKKSDKQRESNNKDTEKDREKDRESDINKQKYSNPRKSRSPSSYNSTLKHKSGDNYDRSRRDNRGERNYHRYNYRNPFKRSISKDKYFGRYDNRFRRRISRSRERRTNEYGRNFRKSPGRSRRSRSRTDDRNNRRSRDRSHGYRGYNERKYSPEQRSTSKRKLSKSPTPQDKPADSKISKVTPTPALKSISNDSTKLNSNDSEVRESVEVDNTTIEVDSTVKEEQKEGKSETESSKETESKKVEFPVKKKPEKSYAKTNINIKRPLSFAAAEFLFPEEAGGEGILESESEGTNDSYNPVRKEQSPDTDDYMDNWENDDVDLDNNSNTEIDGSPISRTISVDSKLEEFDHFVTRYANPSPPSELLQGKLQNSNSDIEVISSKPIKTQVYQEQTQDDAILQVSDLSECTDKPLHKTELFGMQEIYDQFIKSVEASGVDLKGSSRKVELVKTTQSNDSSATTIHSFQEQFKYKRNENVLRRSSVSSTSTSSSSSSTSDESTSSDSSSSSSSSSSESSSSEDSSDASDNKKKVSQKISKRSNINSENMSQLSPGSTISNEASKTSAQSEPIAQNVISNVVQIKSVEETSPKNVATKVSPSPIPLTSRGQLDSANQPLPSLQIITNCNVISNATNQQSNDGVLSCSRTATDAPSKIPKSDATKDFKKLKNLETNLARIQMMKANYDSADEISEELHKMEMLLLKEKKLILQKYTKPTMQPIMGENVVDSAQRALGTSAMVVPSQFVPSMQQASIQQSTSLGQSFTCSATEAAPPVQTNQNSEPNRIFDANREAIKLTISPLKLSKTSNILKNSDNAIIKTANAAGADGEEVDFTEKLVKPVKEVAIVKPIMEVKDHYRESQRHHRSPNYRSSRERGRSPSPRYRDRSKRSSSRSRYSPHRRGGRGRSLSISPPRRNRYSSPSRRSGQGSRFSRTLSRRSRSRSRSRSLNRQSLNRRVKDSRRRGFGQDTQFYYKKVFRTRISRSPQRPRSPRTPPYRRRSYSPDRYSRSPLPFKPPSPPSRCSNSPLHSPSRSSRSPMSPRRSFKRDAIYERHSSLSPSQYYIAEAAEHGEHSTVSSSYYYSVSPNRISLDARINNALNGSHGSSTESPQSFENYASYGQFGSAAYMSVPPQPIPNNVNAYYTNPYVPLGPNGEPLIQSHVQNPHAFHTASLHPFSNAAPALSHITSQQTIHGNIYYNEFCNVPQATMTTPCTTSVLRELPKATPAVAVQKGNVLEIVPSSNMENVSESPSEKSANVDAVRLTKQKSSISWKDEVNNRHIKSAVMRLRNEADNTKRSILKRVENSPVERNKFEKKEKKKVYFEDGIYPSRDSEDEDRKIIEERIKRKVLRLRKKRGIDVAAAREIVGEITAKKYQYKVDPALERLSCPPPPPTLPPAHLEQPIYLKSSTPPVSFLYYHYDAAVHSMYVSNLEKPIPPRLLNPKCSDGGTTQLQGAGAANVMLSNASPLNSNNNNNNNNNSNKKDIMPANIGRTIITTTIATTTTTTTTTTTATNSIKLLTDSTTNQNQIPYSGSPILGINKMGVPVSPQISPLHHHVPSPMRSSTNGAAPMGFSGMRFNNFMRLPLSPLARTNVTPCSKSTITQIPVLSSSGSTGGVRHIQMHSKENNQNVSVMLPPSSVSSSSLPTSSSTTAEQPAPTYAMPPKHLPQPPPAPITVAAAVATTTSIGYIVTQPPPAGTTKLIDQNNHHHHHQNPSPQAMIAPYNIKNPTL